MLAAKVYNKKDINQLCISELLTLMDVVYVSSSSHTVLTGEL